MKKFSIELKWGGIFTIVMLAWMFLEKLLGWHDEMIDRHALLTNLFALPAVLVYLLALYEKREKYYGGKASWLRLFASGILISLVIALLSPLAQYITLKFITPDYLSNAIRHAVSTQQKTLYQAEHYFTIGNYIMQGILGSIALGTVTSAIVALFIRKK